MILYNDEFFMDLAYKEALIAFEEDEVPIGCVLVLDNKIISKAHNQVEKLKDPTAHAEILCISSACSYLNTKFLYNSTIYVTLEPCIMCYGAIELSRISKIVFGVNEPKFGFLTSLAKQSVPNQNGFYVDKIRNLMNQYFISKRKKN